MDPVRDAVIRCLRDYAEDDTRFLHSLNLLAQQEGEIVFPTLLHILTHLDFSVQDARDNWEQILYHQKKMSHQLNRPVSLTTATCDFFSSVQRSFKNPKVVEVETFEKAERSSKIDGLTGLYNRRYFDEALDAETKRAKRYHQNFSLAMFDLDNFKKLNDKLGHQAGDIALKNVAALMKGEKRTEDIVARYGGEEMVMILPQTGKFNALVIADRIRQRIGKVVMRFEETPFQITTSGGVASYPVDGATPEQLLRCADLALYQAKNLGRNRVQLYTANKRHFLRVDFVKEIVITQAEASRTKKTGQARNLSGSGILFSYQEQMALGTEIEVSIPTDEASATIRLTGKVVRVEEFDSSYDIGVSFLKMSDHENSEIASTLSQYLNISLTN